MTLLYVVIFSASFVQGRAGKTHSHAHIHSSYLLKYHLYFSSFFLFFSIKMTLAHILLVGSVQFASDILNKLKKRYSIDYFASKSRQEFIKDCADKYKDVSIIYHSPDAQAVVGPFDAELISHLPPSLKYIVYLGAGYDSINVNACEQRNIYVSHTPMAVDDATADVAAILILACCRNVIAASDNLRLGRFRNGLTMGTDPQGKVLGIVGAGGIGRTLAKRMSGFDLEKIQYYNRHRLSTEGKVNTSTLC